MPPSACLLETPAHWIMSTGSDGEKSPPVSSQPEFSRETELIYMVTVSIKQFTIRNWLMPLSPVTSSKIYRMSHQVGDPGQPM